MAGEYRWLVRSGVPEPKVTREQGIQESSLKLGRVIKEKDHAIDPVEGSMDQIRPQGSTRSGESCSSVSFLFQHLQ